MNVKAPIVILIALLAAPLVRADEVDARSGTGAAIAMKDVRIRGIEGENLVFLTQGGTESSRPLAQVVRMQVTGETAFNDAENHFAAERWPQAGEAYRTALRNTTKDWLRDRIGLRLVEVAGKTGQFELAATAYVALIGRNPALAQSVKPTVPADKEKNAKALADAMTAVNAALADSKLPAERRTSLLAFALEIERARGDQKAQAALVEQMLRLSPQGSASGDLHVIVALTAMDGKEYPKAIDQIEKNRASFTEPGQQVDALWVLAEARYQQAIAGGKQPKKEELQDLAIGFMRVVAQFKESPRAADALARVAGIYEQMQEPKKALELYTQLTREYPNSSAAKAAGAAIEKLKPAAN